MPCNTDLFVCQGIVRGLYPGKTLALMNQQPSYEVDSFWKQAARVGAFLVVLHPGIRTTLITRDVIYSILWLVPAAS